MAKNMHIADDRDLVVGIKKGDPRSFRVLVERHKRRAFYTAVGMIGDRDLALDVTQDAWVATFGACGRLDPSRPFYPYFHRILVNLCKRALLKRGQRGEQSQSQPEAERALDGGIWEPVDSVAEGELRSQVWAAVRELPPEQREVVILSHFENRRYAEIAELVGVPIGTVMSRLHAARRKLAVALSEVQHG